MHQYYFLVTIFQKRSTSKCTFFESLHNKHENLKILFIWTPLAGKKLIFACIESPKPVNSEQACVHKIFQQIRWLFSYWYWNVPFWRPSIYRVETTKFHNQSNVRQDRPIFASLLMTLRSSSVVLKIRKDPELECYMTCEVFIRSLDSIWVSPRRKCG